jgi:hypothetical protein
VAVVVDKAWRYHQTVGIKGASCRTAKLANLNDFAVLHGHIAIKGGGTGAINNATVFDQEIESHTVSFIREEHCAIDDSAERAGGRTILT